MLISQMEPKARASGDNVINNMAGAKLAAQYVANELNVVGCKVQRISLALWPSSVYTSSRRGRFPAPIHFHVAPSGEVTEEHIDANQYLDVYPVRDWK
jgi:hypothetical protein